MRATLIGFLLSVFVFLISTSGGSSGQKYAARDSDSIQSVDPMDQAREDEGIRENKSYPTSLTDRPFRAGVDLVLFPVTVYDERDHFVTGLIKDNFEVFENKNPQNVASFSSEDVPVSIGIIFDVSGSMGHKIDSARMAVSQFLRVSNPADEYFLIGFNDNPVKLSGFTHEVNTLLSKTMFLEPKGRTALLDAI